MHHRDLQPGEKPERGPYSLQDIRAVGQMRKITRSTLVWASGMREWVRLDSLRPVMWYVLSEGAPVLTPSKRGEMASQLLLYLVKLRPSVDIHGAPVRPVPRAKRVLSGARCLPHIAQAMLAGSPLLVDTAAQLITELVHHNPAATVKLYLTGVFFFVFAYTGSNWEAMAKLLDATHLKQSFHMDAATLASESSLGRVSILGSILPESMVCVLANRGPKVFAETFLSNVDTPEVIWKYSMREHLVDLVFQHIGDLSGRLAANPSTLYDYCPIPRVIYEELEAELWCHNFYLANLTDTARFPEWDIVDPVGLLRSVLDHWRAEMEKTGEEALNTDEAYGILGIATGSDAKEIRKAYRKMAMKYHPDKNPQGRDMFEKVQAAYEMLNAARPEMAAGPDPVAILLMVKTQVILFERHRALLAEYKYAGYPLLLEVLKVPADGSITGERADMMEAGTALIHLTCLTSPRNANELIDEGGVEMLLQLLALLMAPGGVTADTDPKAVQVAILANVLHTLSGLATLEDARVRYKSQAGFAANLSAALGVAQSPKVMQHAQNAVIRLAVDPELQNAMVDAGVLWRLVPLLFRFDATLEDAGLGDKAAAEDNEQMAANMHAKMAARSLSRLGGYFQGDAAATPDNPRVKEMCAALLTPVLARRLTRSNPEALLKTLNSHEETPTVSWTGAMRKELLQFAGGKVQDASLTGDMDADSAKWFRYAFLADQLVLAGVYIKHFVGNPAMSLDDPYKLAHDLAKFIATSPANPRAMPPAPRPDGAPEPPPVDPDVAHKHLSQSLRALHMLIINNPGVEDELAGDARGYLPPLIGLVEADGASAPSEDRGPGAGAGAGGARSTAAAEDAPLRELALAVVNALSTHPLAPVAIAEQHLLPPLIRTLPKDPMAVGPVLRALFTHSRVVEEVAATGNLIDLMTLFAGGPASGPGPGQPGGPSVHGACGGVGAAFGCVCAVFVD